MRVPLALLFATLGLAGLAAPPATAQPGDGPSGAWATLTPFAGAVTDVAGRLGDGWHAGPGLAAGITAPLAGGTLRASVTVESHRADVPDLPSFVALAPTLGWGPTLTRGRVEATAGPQLGVAYLRFEPAAGFTGNLQNETEAAVGAFARVRVAVAGRVGAWAEAEALRVAFAEPRTVATLRAGLDVRLVPPSWLRRVLE